MPNRIIREGWLDSDRINELDANTERFFLRLCLKADDFGRYTANATLLRSNLFPLRDEIRSTDIPRWLAACEKAGLLRCYELSGKRYLEIPRFDQRTRAHVSKWPPPAAGSGPPPADARPPPDTCQTDDRHPRTESETEAEPKTETIYCAEPDKPASAPNDQVVMVFPVVGENTEWPLLESKVREYQSSFPALVVKDEFLRARQWCVDNPSRRKTPRGMSKFLFGWLERSQNRNVGNALPGLNAPFTDADIERINRTPAPTGMKQPR